MENTEVKNEDVSNAEDTTDYKALYETATAEVEAKANKVSELESLIQKHKKPVKTDTKEIPIGKEDIEKVLNERDFYKSNPEMSEHKEAIEKFTSNGEISLEQAKMLVIANDPTIKARENTSNANYTDGQSGGGKKSYSQEDLYNLGQKDPALKRQAMELIASGKATETL